MTQPLEVIILAAGQGTRMKSALPKVLHEIGGEPMLRRVHDVARELAPRHIHVVYGHGAEQVRERLADLDVAWVLQERQLGTGHAVAQALPSVGDDSIVLMLYGDVPLIRADTLRDLVAAATDGARRLGYRVEIVIGVDEKPDSLSTWIIWTIARHSIATENIGWATMPRSRVVSR